MVLLMSTSASRLCGTVMVPLQAKVLLRKRSSERNLCPKSLSSLEFSSYNAHLACRLASIPSEIAFQIGMFPGNLPLPSNISSARILGGAMHFLHLCIRIHQIQTVPDSDLGWEDMYRENEGDSWFHWVRPSLHVVYYLLICQLTVLSRDHRTYLDLNI
jgi:hypothetical protein